MSRPDPIEERPLAESSGTWWRAPFGTAALAAAVLLLVVVGPIVQEMTAATGPRYTTSAALLEQGTIVLDDYADNAFVDFIDRLQIDGHLYSDKSPGPAVPRGAGLRSWRSSSAAEPATVQADQREPGCAVGDLLGPVRWSLAAVLLGLMTFVARPLGSGQPHPRRTQPVLRYTAVFLFRCPA